MNRVKSLLKRIQELLLNYDDTEESYGIMPYVYNRVQAKERLHSDLIAHLLRADPIILQSFLEIIELEKEVDLSKTEYAVYTEYSLKSERRIDILITFGEDKAIIIENKLHNAADQKNQLVDYKASIEDRGYTVLAIVYIPLSSYRYAKSDKELGKLVNIWPNELMNWLAHCLTLVKESTLTVDIFAYKQLLKYINHYNRDKMIAEKILSELDNQELSELVHVAQIINSADWNPTRLNVLKEKIALKLSDTLVHTYYANNYMDFWLNDYKFWVEIYAEPTFYRLYIISYQEIKDTSALVSEPEFYHSSNWKGYFCYRSKTNYAFPNQENSLEKLIDKAVELLKISVSDIVI